VGVLLSGLVAFAISPLEGKRLTTAMGKIARKVLRGRACGEKDGHRAAQSNVWALRELRAVPSEVELLVQRLQMWQKAAAHPADFTLVLAVMFGELEGVPQDQQPIDAEGFVGAAPHQWLKQLIADLSYLNNTIAAEWLEDAIQKPLLLFCDRDIADDFCRQDVRLLRSAWRCVKVAPYREGTPLLDDVADPENPFLCQLIKHSGEVCGGAFRSCRALNAHQMHAEDHEMPKRRLATLLTFTNQCISCHAVLATVATARAHLHCSLLRGQCRAVLEKGSPTVFTVEPVHCPVCRICGETLPDINNTEQHAYWHLRTHLPDWQNVLL